MPNLTKNGEVLYQDPKDFPSIIIITCMLSVFSVVGTMGNAFVLYVFSKKKDKNTSTVFILALASIDFVTCLFLIPFTIVVEYHYKKVNNDAVCKIYQFFITSNVPFSAFIMVAIAFDRYFCICRPWVKVLDIPSARKIIASLLIFSLTLGLITTLAYGVYHRKANKLESTDGSDPLNTSVSTKTDTVNGVNGEILQNLFVHDGGLDNCSLVTNKDNNLSIHNGCKPADSDGSNERRNASANTRDFVFTGYCYPSEIIVSKRFRKAYQTFYVSLFLVMFLTVFFLYALILKSILYRRSKRLKSSFTYQSNGKPVKTRRKLCPFLFSKRVKHPEAISMLPCSTDLNNKRPLERKMTNSDSSIGPASVASCMTTTIMSYPDDNQGETAVDVTELSNGGPRVVTNEIIKEESEHSSLAESVSSKIKITSNDLRVDTKNETVSTRTTQSFKSGRSHKKGDKREKNVNRRVLMQTDEHGNTTATTHHESFKVSSYNIYRKDTRKSVKEKHRLANIKTAGILFTVTLVFIIAFLPAWLMATKIIAKPDMILFYMYFIYNVANPFIYAFFNQTFQQEMKTVLKCK